MRITTGGLKEIRDSSSSYECNSEEAKAIDDAYERVRIRKSKELKTRIIVVAAVVIAFVLMYTNGIIG